MLLLPTLYAGTAGFTQDIGTRKARYNYVVAFLLLSEKKTTIAKATYRRKHFNQISEF